MTSVSGRILEAIQDSDSASFYKKITQLTDNQKKVITLIQKNPGLSKSDIISTLRESPQMVGSALSALVKANMLYIQRDGTYYTMV